VALLAALLLLRHLPVVHAARDLHGICRERLCGQLKY
jgi:hypothetical protein